MPWLVLEKSVVPSIPYMTDVSAPVRSVQITTTVIGLELEQKIVNIFEKKEFKPQFVKVVFL